MSFSNYWNRNFTDRSYITKKETKIILEPFVKNPKKHDIYRLKCKYILNKIRELL
ncbi:MAG: hypothetical protein RLY43_214 [Bacteroidota bacterium]|jgi:hypothetical protein